jgi:hypothetical protein
MIGTQGWGVENLYENASAIIHFNFCCYLQKHLPASNYTLDIYTQPMWSNVSSRWKYWLFSFYVILNDNSMIIK